LVFATAISRLHADLLVIRLKQARHSLDRISAIYHDSSRPNCTVNWLNGSAHLSLSSGETVSITGRLRVRMARPDEKSAPNSLSERLGGLGLAHEQSLSVEKALFERRIVVAVEAGTEGERDGVSEILRNLAAENIQSAPA